MRDQDGFTLPPVGLWTGVLDMVPASRARELAAELESLGYGAVWLPEVAGRDPFVHLAMLLSATDRMIGATGIASIWARDAVTTSCAAKTLTEAFPVRVLVGLGVIHENLVGTCGGTATTSP
jgi:alkanesulfonate monooxygenase SsuD/methylene tetrahydromethanopterin reductase-like flavin-dependent oxidoreductase (luciferase family)